MTHSDNKPGQGAGGQKLMDRLIQFFWSGAGGIKIMNRLILILWIWLALAALAVVVAVVGGSRQGTETRNRQKVVKEIFHAVCTSLPEIDSTTGAIPVERVSTAVRNAITEDMTGNFWLCQPVEDTDPLVVYSGPLTDPFVMILFRFGGTTTWSTADWDRYRTSKTAVSLRDVTEKVRAQ